MSAWWEQQEEEPDLDYGDDPLDPSADAPEKDSKVEPRFTTQPPPGAGSVDWNQVRTSLAAHRKRKGRNPDGSKKARTRAETDEAAVTITQAREVISAGTLPRSAKAIAAKFSALDGWTIQAGHSRTRYGAVLYQADSKPDVPEVDQHSRGDVRRPAENREHWAVAGWAAEGQVRFVLYYETRPKGDKVATAFSSGRFHDPVSGTTFFTQATEFDSWMDVFVPRAEPRKPRLSREEKVNDALLGGNEWEA
jgi:hypothetical protein